MRKIAAIGIVLLLAACGKQGGNDNGQPPQPLTGEPTKVVAQVGAEKITLAEVTRVVKAWRMGRFREVDPNGPEGELQKKAVDNLVDQKLLMKAAKEKGLMASEDEVNSALQNIKSRFPDEATFNQALQQQGVTEDDVKDGFRSDMSIRRFIETTFMDTVKVTPEAAKAYYDSHPDEFMRPEMVHARHILITVAPDASPVLDKEAHDRADAALARVKRGEDFGKVASEVSEDPGSKMNGGDLSFFPRGQMVAPFDSIAFALAPGEVSPVFKTQFGYHVIKTEEKRAAGSFAFEEIAERLFPKLRQDRTDGYVKAFLEEQKKKVKVKREI